MMDNAVYEYNRKQQDGELKLGFAGQKPKTKIEPADPNKPRKPSGFEALTEKQKYEKMWGLKNGDYRAVSPGELAGNTFISVVKPKPGEEVIDFGCGTGRGSLWLGAMGGLNVTMLDFASNALDPELKIATQNQPDKYQFIEHDLTEKIPFKARYGYCTDVLEHIPPEDVDRVLVNILGAAQSVFFRISTGPDIMGPKYLNQPLHLSVHPYAWWISKFIEHGCTILHSEDLGGAVDVYVTAWASRLPDMEINTSVDQLKANIAENAKFGCMHIKAHEVQDAEVMLLCGGPSLNDFKDEIIEKWKSGIKVVTVNGAYNWALENGITNVNQCMLDSRPFNIRFVQPPRDDCYYFIGSGCDPSVFESLPKDRTFYWHVNPHKECVETIAEHYPEWLMISGGSTVTTRAMVLLRILGFKNQTVYGMDSCLRDGEHHAYKQKENDFDPNTAVMQVMVEGKTFDCHPWMALQATEFAYLVANAGDEFNFTIKGDGLISWVYETKAEPPASPGELVNAPPLK